MSKLHNWAGRFALIAVVLFIVWLAFLFRETYLPWSIAYAPEIYSGNRLIEAIEAYRLKKGRLPDPNTPSEVIPLGFEETAAAYRPLYEADPDGSYEIVYGFGFDGPYVSYSSKTRKWERRLCQ